jgi:hypothetical protein
MDNKFKPGNPEGFSLNVDPVRDLGDYLDEPSPVVPRKAREENIQQQGLTAAPVGQAASTSRSAAESSAPPRPITPSPVATQPATPPVTTPAPETVQEKRGAKPKSPRREISMTPDTLRMSDELLDIIRSRSGQRDTKANELFHALVLLVHEVRDELDPHTIPKRGRWGTPTARAYPLELKNAFLRALLEMYGKGTDGLAGLNYPVNSAA